MMEARHLDLTSAEEECGDSAMGRVRRAYATLEPGERLEVVTGVAEQVFGIRAWSRALSLLIGGPRSPGLRPRDTVPPPAPRRSGCLGRSPAPHPGGLPARNRERCPPGRGWTLERLDAHGAGRALAHQR